MGVIFLSSSSSNSIRCCRTIPRPSTQAVHQLLRTARPQSSWYCFSLLADSWGSIVPWELMPKELALPRCSSRHLHVALQLARCHHQMASDHCSVFPLDLRARCSATLVSRLLSVVHIIGLCGLHFSVQVEIENVVFEIHWNELVLSIPAHQFLKMNSHSVTNFVVNRDHVATFMFRIEILSSSARDLCSIAQHHTGESSVQRSEQTVFVVSLKLPSSTIRNPFTTDIPIESSISSLQLLCPVFFHPFKPLRTTHGTKINNFQVKISLLDCHKFDPNLHAIHPNSSHPSINCNSDYHSIHHNFSQHETKNCQWDTSVQIPEFPSLFLISIFKT